MELFFGPAETGLSNATAVGLTIAILCAIGVHTSQNRLRMLTGRNVALLAVLLWYLLEATLLPKALGVYEQQEYDFGVLCVGLAAGAFLAGYHLLPEIPLFQHLERRLALLHDTDVVWTLFLCGVGIGFGALLLYVDFDFSALFNGLVGLRKRWTGQLVRGRYGNAATMLYELQMFLKAAVPLATMLAFSPRVTPGRRLTASGFLLWMSLQAFAGGTRSDLIPVALPIAAAVFWKATAEGKRLLIILGIPTAFILGLWISAIIVPNRDSGELDVTAASKADYVGFEMFRELLFVIRTFPNRIGHQFGWTYVTQIVNPIPRFFWPDKPTADAGLLLAEAYGALDEQGEAYLTVSPGFVGESYLNFGVFGILLVPVIAGVFVRAWDRLFRTSSHSFPTFLLFAAGLASILASGRSFNMSTFYGLIALYVLLVLFSREAGFTRVVRFLSGSQSRQSGP